MQSRLLRSFLIVAENGSITVAADILHISQPALSKSMQNLEREFGVKLFDRVAGGVILTKSGEILQHHAKIMDNEYRHAVSRIDEMRDGRAGVLRIGAGPVWLVSILPPIITEFQVRNPNIKISLIGGVIDTLLPALIGGDLDLICVSLDFPNRSEVTKKSLFDIRHVLVADPTHPLVGDGEFDADSIQGYPWIVLKNDYVGTERISSFFAANGLKPPNITFETTSIHSLLQGLKGGKFIAHIPIQMLSIAENDGLRRINIRQVFWETTGGYAHRATPHLTAPLKQMIAILRAELTSERY